MIVFGVGMGMVFVIFSGLNVKKKKNEMIISIVSATLIVRSNPKTPGAEAERERKRT